MQIQIFLMKNMQKNKKKQSGCILNKNLWKTKYKFILLYTNVTDILGVNKAHHVKKHEKHN